MTDQRITQQVIGTAIEIHKALGPGLLENAYQECLAYKLRQKQLMVYKEHPLPLVYEKVKLDCGYRVDLLIEGRIVVEVKCVESLNDVHLAQTLTYLKVGGFQLGLLINFNVLKLTNGLRRVVNNYDG